MLRLTQTQYNQILRKNGKPVKIKEKQPQKKNRDWPGYLITQLTHLKLPLPEQEVHLPGWKRPFRADLIWPERKILVECDGGTDGFWRTCNDGTKKRMYGAHSHGTGYAKDCVKLNEAAKMGYTVYRFTSKQIRQGIAVEFLEQVLR
ncbi:MAG: hypothetical protein KAI17_03425 [Thiotrichaceae bacterium]|nr:hypothetical protein [Thiotrichaceae bacterium]